MEVKGERDVTDAAAADEWVGAFQFGRSTDGRGKRQAARGPVASQTKENGRRREGRVRGAQTSGEDKERSRGCNPTDNNNTHLLVKVTV